MFVSVREFWQGPFVYTPTFSAMSKFLSLWIIDNAKIQLTARVSTEVVTETEVAGFIEHV